MAKVMISLPDDVLSDIDREAARRGTTRSNLIREATSELISRRSGRRARIMAELDRQVTGHGGNVVEDLRRSRKDAR